MTELVAIEKVSALEVFTQSGVDPILEAIEKEVGKFTADTSTAKGRKEIASMANKIARSKTYLDGLGKDLVSEWKKQAKVVDESRRKIRDRLDVLKAEIRAPLSDWETKEKLRVEHHRARMNDLKAVGDNPDLTAVELRSCLESVEATPMGGCWEEFAAEAAEAKDAAIARLKSQILAREKYEAEQAELERLRKEQIEREQRERDERIAKEAAEKAQREAEEKARREAEAKELEHKKALEAKRLADERAAKLEQEAKEREARIVQEKKEAEAKAKRDAELAVQREKERVEAERLREIEAQKRREADKQHRAKINMAAAESIAEFSGITIDQAKKVVIAIASNEVPAVSIRY